MRLGSRCNFCARHADQKVREKKWKKTPTQPYFLVLPDEDVGAVIVDAAIT
jgi:hypothetical protein